MVAPQNPTAPVKEGDVLAAKYRIEGVIGAGGMGVVVSAMHLELEQRVALKFLLPQAATNDELVGRFVREARASVKLKGTHVAKVLDVGRMDDGRAYIVMEYLDGRDLGAELKASTEQFAIEDAVSWMLQACEGLAEAHALGIVHRDLKPANLFLSRSPDGRALVKVLDFGISKSINPNSSDMLSLTKTEMLLGSPLYMAPEQMRSSKYVDERSDIWALGAIAYELLTRKVPFEADTLLDLCFKVAQEGCRSVHEVRPDVPRELSDVVMRCLEKDAQARWVDIGELASALEPFAAPADHGSAARTIGILAGGERAGTRKPLPSVPSSGETADAASVSDAARTSDPGRTTGPNPTSVAKQKHISEEHVITGTAVTERAVGDDRQPAPDDGSAPDAVPASSAWGTTNAARVEKKSRRGIVAVASVAIALAGVAVVLGRGSGATVPTAVTTGATTAVSAAPAPPPEPPSQAPPSIGASATTTPPASSAAPIESQIPAPRASAPTTRPAAVAASPPRPKASAPASATSAPSKAPEPASTGGFIRVRE